MKPARPACCHRPSRRGAQRGAVLMMVVAMLVIVGLASVAVMRNALSADLVAEGTQRRLAAWHAAASALRYCEAELLRPTPAIGIYEAAPEGAEPAWRDLRYWTGATRVPAARDEAGAGSSPPAMRPQCLAEHARLAAGAPVVVVTARGYSPDYGVDDVGVAASGAVVWLQSVLTLAVRREDAGTELGGDPMPGTPPEPMVETPPAPEAPTCDAACSLVVVDRVWKPILNPPQP